MSFSDGAAVCNAACAGYGLAQLQDYFVDAGIAQGKLVAVLDRFKPEIEPIWLVYPRTRHIRQFKSNATAMMLNGNAPRLRCKGLIVFLRCTNSIQDQQNQIRDQHDRCHPRWKALTRLSL